MKLILLVDCSMGEFKTLIDLIQDKKSALIDTRNCDEQHEHSYLMNCVKEFTQSSNEIMIARFSGREDIVRELGDVFSEMIVSLSFNKNSRYFAENPVDMFLDLTKFLKET